MTEPFTTNLQLSGEHGKDCPKVAHVGEGYLHAADDDRPYEVDGVMYCGRCHAWMGLATGNEQQAVIRMQGWDGYSEAPVLVVGETPKRYRIKAIQRTKLAGRNRWIEKDQTALVPRHAVRIQPW